MYSQLVKAMRGATTVRHMSGSVKAQAANSKRSFDPFAQSPRAAPERPVETAAELWTAKHAQPPPPLTPADTQDPQSVLYHPLFTPAAYVNTDIGPLVGPLKWPEFDQSGLLASKNPKILSPPGPDPRLADFEDPYEAPIGNYPRIPHQFTELKDPFKYWDMQGRRNYGEIIADQEFQMNVWSHGPGVDKSDFVRAVLVVFAGFAGLFGVVHAWDPSLHLRQAEKDYPFDGLHLELGADPNDLEDTAVTARQYKNQFDPTYKPI